MRRLLLCLFLSLAFSACEKEAAKKSITTEVGLKEHSTLKTDATTDEVLKIVDPAAIDPSVNPCDNFYQYSCGTWLNQTKLPEDQPSIYKSDFALKKVIRKQMKEALTEYSRGNTSIATKNAKILGNYYTACLNSDSEQIEGMAVFNRELQAIDSIKTIAELSPAIARLHSFNISSLFTFGVEADLKDASKFVVSIDDGGLVLPNRDIYVSTDPDDKDTLANYQDHINRSFQLLGVTDFIKSTDIALGIDKLEIKLAKASLPAGDRAVPQELYNIVDLNALETLAPTFAWDAYFAALKINPATTKIVVRNPHFLKRLETILKETPLETLKNYMKFQVNEEFAWYINDKFNDEAYLFWDHYLNGQTQIQAKEDSCLDSFDGSMAEALGEVLVKSSFKPQIKADAEAMIDQIKRSFDARLDQLPWLDRSSRVQAHKIFAQLKAQVAFPTTWKSLDGLEIDPRGSQIKNLMAVRLYDTNQMIAKINQTANPNEWNVATEAVDAFYSHQRNELILTAGLLLPPNFDMKASAGANFGNLGITIGNELSRAVSLEGSFFDERGNDKEWWSTSTKKNFSAKAQCLVDQANAYTIKVPIEGTDKIEAIAVDGDRTLEKNIADQAGATIAYDTLTQNAKVSKKDAQDFFVSYAQSWCNKRSEESLRRQLDSDNHPPAEYRVNGVFKNLPAFQEAFACKTGSPMAPAQKDRCDLWSGKAGQ